MISGFTFIHNAISSGYPIVEAIRAVQPYVDEVVVVDMQSTDSTREVLEALSRKCLDGCENQLFCKCAPIRILNGFWGNQAGETLRQAHSKYKECARNNIIHFEADEVYDDRLIRRIVELIKAGRTDIAVMRLQIEQNFQRCRWYPEPVHRIFPKLSNTRKEGHTTNRHEQALVLGPEDGFLWDVTNCFRDNWFNRVDKQAQLRDELPHHLMVGLHCLNQVRLSAAEVEMNLHGRHFTWTDTPFNIPEILRPLVGMVRYEAKI